MHPPHHTCRHEQCQQRVKHNIHNTTSPYCGVPLVKISQYMDIFVWHFFLKVCCMSFWWHDCSEQTEEWKLHFARKCLHRKWGIMHRKTNQALQLAHFFKMQKLIGCDTTTRKYQLLVDSLPFPGHTNMHFIYNFRYNDFYHGCNSVMQSTWAWYITPST